MDEETCPSVSALLGEIEWTSPFIMGLLIFHLIWGVICALTMFRGKEWGIWLAMVSAFAGVLGRVFNSVLARFHEEISLPLDLFDPDRGFGIVFLAAPMGLILCGFTVSFAVRLVPLMIRNLRAKAMIRARKKAEKEE
jgi:hypothetical protein